MPPIDLKTRRTSAAAGKTSRLPIVPVDEDDDAPQNEHHEGDTSQILASAIRNAEPGSESEKALLAVMNLLVHKHSGGGGGNVGGLSRRFIGAISGLVVLAMTVVSPVVDQVAELSFSPSSALDRKLDDTIARQTELQEQQQQMNAAFLSFAKWAVECEMASRSGAPMPKLPALVQLILVQDEVRTTPP